MTRLPLSVSGLAALLFVLMAGCTQDDTDAWGTFEATETRIATELPGRLLRLDPREGSDVVAGSVIALIDTSAMALQRGEIVARRSARQAQLGDLTGTAASLDQQLTILRGELARTTRLQASQAATGQQVDRANREVIALQQQRTSLDAARQTALAEIAAWDAQLAQLADRMHRGEIVSTVSGTVLTRIVEPGEVVQAGAPLLTVAALDTLVFRAYLGGDQLARLHVGSTVQVRVDAGNGALKTVDGAVTWISSSAEFTPTPIQTRKERTTQVYAVKVAVPNPGRTLRIGMPGELLFVADSTTR